VTRERIKQGSEKLGITLSEDQADRLSQLLAELERWNRRMNLTAIRDPKKMVAGHILDSLAVVPHLRGEAILDVGTGPGFPGLPLAIVEPDRRFVLLDSNGKKISFVNHAIGQLGLENATAIKARAEHYAPGARFDTVTARALATVPRLIELSAHLVGEDGRLLALKGRYPAAELDAIQALPDWDYSVTELTVPGLEAHERHLVTVRRKKTES
jgi:16S rRNA (guanine527-N7)-methyltransferase